MILTSAPRSSFLSATHVQTRLATPRSIPLHRPVLVTPQKRLIETTPTSPPIPSQDLKIPDLGSPRYQPFHFPTQLFSSHLPPLSLPLARFLPPVYTTEDRTVCHSGHICHHEFSIGFNKHGKSKAELRVISYVFHAVSHASPRDAIHLPEAHSRRTCKFTRACDP